MTIKLGLNIAVPGLLGNLNRSTDRVGQVLQRLSSGQRINSAGDDPAGLAVAAKLKVDSAIATQARRNVNDAISFLSVTDSALNAIKSLEERKAELAEQSANGVFSDAQRQALQEEYTQLDLEIQRITKTTKFNDISLLSGQKSANEAQTFATDPALSASYYYDISGNGRYGIFITLGSDLQQIDFETGEVTTIATGILGDVSQSASGDRVLFGSTDNLTGEDPSGYGQLYVWDRNTGQIDQITNSANTEIYQDPALYSYTISADGSTVAFTSATRYNSDGSVKSYALSATVSTVNLDTGVYTDSGLALTSNTDFLTLSADGTQIAFSSYNDVDGGNPEFSNEIYTFNVSDPTNVNRVTDFAAGTLLFGFQILNNGNLFYSYVNGGSSELLLYDAASNSSTSLVSGAVITDRISNDDSTLYIRTGVDLTGENPEGLSQQFAYDVTSGEFTQLTNYTGTSPLNAGARTSADGRYIIQAGGNILQRIQVGANALDVQIETGTGEDGIIQTTLDAARTALGGIGGLLITQQRNAQAALENARSNIEALGNLTGNIGASLSRLESANRTIAEIAREKDNARSRIEDADVALEAAELIKAQILQQAATGLLAQANQSSGLVLRLLGIRN